MMMLPPVPPSPPSGPPNGTNFSLRKLTVPSLTPAKQPHQQAQPPPHYNHNANPRSAPAPPPGNHQTTSWQPPRYQGGAGIVATNTGRTHHDQGPANMT